MENEFFYPVRKVPCFELYKNDLNIQWDFLSFCSDAIIVSNKETGKDVTVGFCSQDYGLIHTSEIFPPFEEALNEKGFKFSKEYKVFYLSRFFADYICEKPQFIVGDLKLKDVLVPFIKIQHSYNGQIAFKIIFSLYRITTECSMFGVAKILEAVHTKEIMEGIFEESMEALDSFVNELSIAKSIYDDMAAIRLGRNWRAQLQQIFDETKVLKGYQEQITEWINNQTKFPLTYWTLYNAFVYQLNHNEELITGDDYKMKLDRKIFTYIVNTFIHPVSII